MINIHPGHLKSACGTCKRHCLMAEQLLSARRMLITAPASSVRQTCTAFHLEPPFQAWMTTPDASWKRRNRVGNGVLPIAHCGLTHSCQLPSMSL